MNQWWGCYWTDHTFEMSAQIMLFKQRKNMVGRSAKCSVRWPGFKEMCFFVLNFISHDFLYNFYTLSIVYLENAWSSKQMITEGEVAILLETTWRAFRNQSQSKQRSTLACESIKNSRKILFNKSGWDIKVWSRSSNFSLVVPG